MVDVSPSSTGNAFRRRRIDMLNRLIGAVLAEKPSCRVLDIGGTVGFWATWREMIDWSRVSITCVNRDPGHAADGDTPATMAQGDARDLKDVADGAYDVVFSNSVIEHVGVWDDMAAMAAEVRRVAPRYLIQTPYFWFPVEPHARTPLLHWLPEPIAYRIVMWRKCGFWRRHDTVAGAVRQVQSARLLDARQMAALFPDAEIRRERFMLMTKALIAVRGRDAGAAS